MTTILFMVSVALLLSLTFIGCYLWNLASGQYDDLVTPAMRILFDDYNEKIERDLDENQRTTK